MGRSVLGIGGFVGGAQKRPWGGVGGAAVAGGGVGSFVGVGGGVMTFLALAFLKNPY